MPRFAWTTDSRKLHEHRLREMGYGDGYARPPRTARFTLREYQVGYRAGVIAREAEDEANDAA